MSEKPESNQGAMRLRRAFEPANHQLMLETFDQCLRVLQAVRAIGPLHELTQKWCEYRKEFKDLHLRARMNASRLADCLTQHYEQVFRVGNTSVEDRRACLEAFQKTVRRGGEQALEIQHKCDALTVKVDGFPKMMMHVVSKWGYAWSRVQRLCLSIKHQITSFWNHCVTKLLLYVGQITNIVGRFFGVSVEISRSGHDSAEFDEKSCVSPQSAEILFVEAVEQADGHYSVVIRGQLSTFEECWAGLSVALDKLEYRIQGSKAIGIQDKIADTIREAFEPVINDLTEFARGQR